MTDPLTALAGLLPLAAGGRQVALWMAQEPGNRIATATAATFLLGGVVGYALRVGPQVAAAEAALEQ